MRRAVVALLFLPVWAHAADEERLPAGARQSATALHGAWNANDQERFERLARRYRPSPQALVGTVLRRYGPSREDETLPQPVRGMLEAYARHVPPDLAPGVQDTIRAWIDAPLDAYRTERRLAAIAEKLLAQRARRGRRRNQELIAELREELASIRMPDHTVAGLNARFAAALFGETRHDELVRLLADASARHRLDLVARVHFQLGDASRRRDQGAVISHWTVARDVFEHLGDWDQVSRVENRLGFALFDAGRFTDAEAVAQRLLTRHDGRSVYGLRARQVLANIDVALSDLDAAAGAYERLVADANRPYMLVGMLTRLALVRARQGRADEALALLARAEQRAVADGEGGLRSGSSIRSGYGALEVYLHLGLMDEAVAEARRQIEERPRQPVWRARVHTKLGNALLARGDLVRARAPLEAAVAFERTRKSVDSLAAALTALSVLERRSGNHATALARASEAVDTARRPDVRSEALAARGGAQLVLDRPTQALADFEQALELCGGVRAASTGSAGTSLLGDYARALMRSGDAKRALEVVRDALFGLLLLSAGLGDDDSLAVRGKARVLAGQGVAAAWQLLQSAPEQRDAWIEAAWWCREAGSAAKLAEAVAGVDSNWRAHAPRKLRLAERDALEALRRAQADLVGATAATATDPKVLAATHAAQRRAYDALAAATRALVRTARVNAVGFARAQPRSLEDTQALLGARDVLVSYLVERDAVFAWVVGRGHASFQRLEHGHLADRVTAWLDLVSAPGGPENKLARRIYEQLWMPIEAQIPKNATVTVIPDGALGAFPFDALVDAQGQRLVERHAIAYAPSATVLGLLHATSVGRSGRGIVALGDPASDLPLPRLAASGREAQAVADFYDARRRVVLRGEAAELGALLAAQPGPDEPALRALHLACHGLIDGRSPRLSGLALAGSTRLDVETLFRTKLRADVAVCSACRTAGGVVQRGEGVIGLTRGFFYAGVPRVVVSAWPVSDAGTLPLMTALHRGIGAERQEPVEALRNAKRAALRRTDGRAHPYHWAAFMLWGVPRM